MLNCRFFYFTTAHQCVRCVLMLSAPSCFFSLSFLNMWNRLRPPPDLNLLSYLTSPFTHLPIHLSHSLHLTTFCLQYKPTVIACVCIHLACKWSNWEIPVSTDGKHWWQYVDSSVRLELLDGETFISHFYHCVKEMTVQLAVTYDLPLAC